MCTACNFVVSSSIKHCKHDINQSTVPPAASVGLENSKLKHMHAFFYNYSTPMTTDNIHSHLDIFGSLRNYNDCS